MNQRLYPLIVKQSKYLDWKLNKNKSPLENMKILLERILKEVKSIRKQKITAPQEKTNRQRLHSLLEELGINLQSVEALYERSNSQRAIEINKKIEAKSTPDLNRDFLALAKNIENVREKSTGYQEAWKEIESEYFLKLSLYNIEILRRQS